MKKLKLLIAMMIVSPLYAADNEIYIDQSGSTANIDLEQLGNSNIIGGLNSVAGTLTALDLDGLNLTLDINQIGNTCLLYTSPSPRDGLLSRMPSSA